MGRIRRRWAALAAAAAACLAVLGVAAPAVPADAATTTTAYADWLAANPSTPFPSVWEGDVLGDFATVGNSWLGCYPRRGCDRQIPVGLSGDDFSAGVTVYTANDNDAQIFVGQDAYDRRVASTAIGNATDRAADAPVASSGATVVIPAGARVVRAELSWGAHGPGTTQYTTDPSAANSVLRAPSLRVGDGGAFVAVPADTIIERLGSSPQFYSAFADVTAEFAGASGTVNVSTLPGPMTTTGLAAAGSASGWAITVVYTFDDSAAGVAAGATAKHVQLLDGMYILTGNSTKSFDLAFAPIPVANGYHVGFVAYEGDLTKTGDTFKLSPGAIPISPPWSIDAGSSQTNNFFGSVAKGSIPLEPMAAYGGAWPADKSADTWVAGNTYPSDAIAGQGYPATSSQHGYTGNFSVDAFDWTPTDFPWTVGQDSSTVTMTSTSSEGYFMQAMTLATPLGRLSVSKTADVGRAHVGDVVTFDIAVHNVSPVGVDVEAVTVDDPTASTPVFDADSPENRDITTSGGALVSIQGGGEAHFTATRTVTAADLAAGRITNEASASGRVAGTGTPVPAVTSNTVIVPITAIPDPADPALAETGYEAGPWLLGGGLLLLAVGGGLLALRRRRRV